MLSNSLDELCIRIAKDDDQVAFESLFQHFYKKLFVFIKTFVKNQESTEEVVADVFIKLWQNRKSLPGIKHLNYYLFVTAKHAAFDYLAKNKKNITVNIDEVDIEFGEMIPNPEELLMSAEALSVIQQAIQTLPPKCKLVFQLIKEEGLKYREVAEILSLSVKTVETQMSLAFAKIGEELSKVNVFPSVKNRAGQSGRK